MEGQSKEENVGSIINTKDLLKSHMETFYHRVYIYIM